MIPARLIRLIRVLKSTFVLARLFLSSCCRFRQASLHSLRVCWRSSSPRSSAASCVRLLAAPSVLLGVTAMMLSGAFPPVDALRGYADPIGWLVLAAFISRGMIKTGLGDGLRCLFVKAIGGAITRLGLFAYLDGYGSGDDDSVECCTFRRHHLSNREVDCRKLRVTAGPDARRLGASLRRCSTRLT